LNNNSLIKNSFYNVVYKVLNVVFPLLTATYTARIIFADGVGEVSYAQNIVSYFTTIAALGIPNYGIREVTDNSELADVTEIFIPMLENDYRD